MGSIPRFLAVAHSAGKDTWGSGRPLTAPPTKAPDENGGPGGRPQSDRNQGEDRGCLGYSTRPRPPPCRPPPLARPRAKQHAEKKPKGMEGLRDPWGAIFCRPQDQIQSVVRTLVSFQCSDYDCIFFPQAAW